MQGKTNLIWYIRQILESEQIKISEEEVDEIIKKFNDDLLLKNSFFF